MNPKRDDIYKALADNSRRLILAALCQGPCRAGELARKVGLAPNAISFHLRLLRSAELVSVNRKGRFLWYQVEPATLADWQAEVHRAFSIAIETDGQRKPSGRRASRLRQVRRERKVQRRAVQTPPGSRSGLVKLEDVANDILPTELL